MIRDITTRPTAVLGDLNALYQASKDSPEAELDFAVLKEAVSARFAMGDPKDSFTLWSSSSPTNPGQQRLLQFLESKGFTIRRFAPGDSFVVDPAQLELLIERKSIAFQRFSGSIAFAAGVLCKSHRIVLISDSFQLSEPLLRASRLAGIHGKSGLAYWGTRLEPRWHSLLRNYKSIELLDLDHVDKLFRTKGEPAGKHQGGKSGYEDNFLEKQD